jgi:hypothetical protein
MRPADRPWIGRNQSSTIDIRARFLEKTRRDESGCLIWIGAVNANGYGSIVVGGRAQTASRVAYELFIGEIPDGLCVCHRCDNPICMEPSHLFAGTNMDNRRDCKEKGRANGAIGERNCKAKLAVDDVIAIRRSGDRTSALARRYQVHRSTILMIRKRLTWRHVDAQS